jgi:ABC-type sugar transport system substrate-binding protein
MTISKQFKKFAKTKKFKGEKQMKSKKLKSIIHSGITAAIVASMLVGCSNATTRNAQSNTSSKKGESVLYKLTEKDVHDIYQEGTQMQYQDIHMKTPVKSAALQDLELTDAEKQKIRSMKLKIAFEKDALDDAGKLQLQGAKEVANDLGITIKDTWIAADKTGVNQLDDYQRIEAIAQKYDAIFTLPIDLAATSEILKKIMKKTKVGFLASAPFNMNWNDPNFVGVSDADGYMAGVYSAKAAIKIANGKGTIGEIGWINGKNGSFHTVQKRYEGWDSVFKQNPNVKVVQKFYDSPVNAKQVISSMLASNPDIKVLLIDFANPPADQAQAILKERGLQPWKDIAMVTIDLDNTITVPMATSGPNNNYTAAFVTQTWYNVGKNLMKLYAKNLLNGDKAPKFVASPPLPITTWNNLKTNYEAAVPSNYNIPQEIKSLSNQWQLGVKDQWNK